MDKDRVKEVREGLEKGIYKKLQKLENLEEPDRLYSTKTESLASFLPTEEDEIKTIELIDQEEVEIEVNQEDVVKEYNNFIHEDNKKLQEAKTDNPLSTEKIKEQVLGDIDNISIEEEKEEEIILEVETQKIEVPKEESSKVEPVVILETDESIDLTVQKAKEQMFTTQEMEEPVVQESVQTAAQPVQQKVQDPMQPEVKEVVVEKEQVKDQIVQPEVKEAVQNSEDKETVQKVEVKEDDDDFILIDEEEEAAEEIVKKNKKSIIVDIFLFLIIILLISLIFYLS